MEKRDFMATCEMTQVLGTPTGWVRQRQELASNSISSLRNQYQQLQYALALLDKEASASEIVEFVRSLTSVGFPSSEAHEMAERIRSQELTELFLYLRDRS